MSTRVRWWPLLLLACSVGGMYPAVVWADEPDLGRLVITPRQAASSYFGGDDITLDYAVGLTEPSDGRARWSFSVDQHVVARGEAPLALEPGGLAEFTLKFKAPAVKQGIVLAGRVSIIVTVSTRPATKASLERPVWLFPKEPFAGRTRSLQERKIVVFDPPGRTADLLKTAGLPFTEVTNLDALGELAEGTVIVGEGVSFASQRGIPEVLFRAAAKGVSVLCLAPIDGVLPLPDGSDHDLPAPSRLTFRRNDVITELDKRLAPRGWPEDGKEIASGLVLRGEGSRVVAEINTTAPAWPWVEIDFPESGSRIVMCGFALISHWDAGPTPRFLLSRALDRAGRVDMGRQGRAQE